MTKRDFQQQEYAVEAARLPDPVVQDWLESRKIIADFLRQLNPGQTEEAHLHNSAALIARLAQANFLMHKITL